MNEPHEDLDGASFLRYETVPIVFAVFRVNGAEHRMGRSRVELRAVSMMNHGHACPETHRALSGWPDKETGQ